MKGANGNAGGYLSYGYLLIVGEIEIVPAQNRWVDSRRGTCPGSTRSTSSTATCTTPTRVATCSIQSWLSAASSATTQPSCSFRLQTAVNVRKGEASYGFDRSHYLTLQGFRTSRGGGSDSIDFDNECDKVERDWGTKGASDFALMPRRTPRARIQRLPFSPLLPAETSSTWPGMATLAYAMTSAPAAWPLRLIYSQAPTPFVYASSCLTGRYPDGESRQ